MFTHINSQFIGYSGDIFEHTNNKQQIINNIIFLTPCNEWICRWHDSYYTVDSYINQFMDRLYACTYYVYILVSIVEAVQ